MKKYKLNVSYDVPQGHLIITDRIKVPAGHYLYSGKLNEEPFVDYTSPQLKRLCGIDVLIYNRGQKEGNIISAKETNSHNIDILEEVVNIDKYEKYKRYIPAIKTKPFLLLAGISGTGKSRLVKEFAYITCPNKDNLQKDPVSPGNYLLIEVKPNWHDSTELLGYESAITHKYIVTPFVKFLIKALCYSDVPFFLCMDEMNLAPVEQYFAEFLSVLESRKIIDGVIKSEPLIFADIFNNYESQLHADLLKPTDENREEYEKFNTVYEILKKEGLRIPSNLIVVGTVNMDETTHQFSRKVIDRAMTIEMNIDDSEEPFNKFFTESQELAYLEKPLPKELFLPTAVQAKEVLGKLSNEDRNYLTENTPILLHSLNQALKGTPFKIAYRVQNELILYFYELRNKQKNASSEELLIKAMDAILMFKVLPRIEGDEEMLEIPLKELHRFTENYEQAHNKVNEMQQRLKAHFTSFWP